MLTAPDGRALDHVVTGDDGPLVLSLHGTPQGHDLAPDGRVPDLSVVSARGSLGPAVPLPSAEHLGLVVEVVSPSSRKTDRFAKSGEYADVGIPLFWRVETEPDLLLVAYRLADGVYEQAGGVRDTGPVPAPWGPLLVDLEAVRRRSS
jgi:hypothetical protein